MPDSPDQIRYMVHVSLRNDVPSKVKREVRIRYKQETSTPFRELA